jgi:hypothetical protein
LDRVIVNDAHESISPIFSAEASENRIRAWSRLFSVAGGAFNRSAQPAPVDYAPACRALAIADIASDTRSLFRDDGRNQIGKISRGRQSTALAQSSLRMGFVKSSISV